MSEVVGSLHFKASFPESRQPVGLGFEDAIDDNVDVELGSDGIVPDVFVLDFPSCNFQHSSDCFVVEGEKHARFGC